MEQSFSFVDDIKCEGMLDIYKRAGCHQAPLSGLRNLLTGNSVNSTKGNANNSMHCVRLGYVWLESRFAKKDLEVLVDKKMSVSQLCALAALWAANSTDN